MLKIKFQFFFSTKYIMRYVASVDSDVSKMTDIEEQVSEILTLIAKNINIHELQLFFSFFFFFFFVLRNRLWPPIQF